MYERILTIETLEQIETTVENLLKSTVHIEETDELTKSADGMLRLNGICMSFIIIGEEIKRIDRYTKKQFLPNYPSIPWNDIMGMRDRIAHGYFEIDIDVIFDTLKNDIPPLLAVIKQMKKDITISE
ncbi:MAG TPA: DUF86 domain-containing protein [Petrimonas sp.]|uniref:HepT-like ribonuclease domain-containing protein n=1 Tax=Petrimonas sp. TaxID=2023866 RepID=UPI0017743E3F|nr:DUF86 domain-containing protein [Petrimonas sp.]